MAAERGFICGRPAAASGQSIGTGRIGHSVQCDEAGRFADAVLYAGAELVYRRGDVRFGAVDIWMALAGGAAEEGFAVDAAGI